MNDFMTPSLDVSIEVLVIAVCQPKATIVISVCQNCGFLTLATLMKGTDVLKILNFGRLLYVTSFPLRTSAILCVDTVPHDPTT